MVQLRQCVPCRQMDDIIHFRQELFNTGRRGPGGHRTQVWLRRPLGSRRAVLDRGGLFTKSPQRGTPPFPTSVRRWNMKRTVPKPYFNKIRTSTKYFGLLFAEHIYSANAALLIFYIYYFL